MRGLFLCAAGPAGPDEPPVMTVPILLLLERLFGPRRIPPMARPTFRYDLLASLFASLGGAALAPQFTGLFARKTLDAAWLVPVLVAQGAAVNFLSTFLAPTIQRRDRIRLLVACRALIGLLLASVALMPASPSAAVAYPLLLAAPLFLGAIVMNAKTSIWHSNYSEQARGRIFYRIMIISMAAMAVAARLAAWVLDTWSWGHRIVYPAAGACMLLAALFVSRIRLRGRRSLLRNAPRRRFHPIQGFRLLWEDRAFGRFMGWQMLSGGAVLFSVAVFPLLLPDLFGVNYGQGTTALVLVPFGLSILCAPFAGRLFDRLGITQYRALGAGVWVVGRTGVFLGALLLNWPLLLAGFAIQGMGGSLGHVAWNIGHTRFATPRRTQEYMGLHMTLQGIRGMTLPFVGVLLYHWLGVYVLLIPTVMQAVAAVGFYRSPAPDVEPRSTASPAAANPV